MRHHLMAALLLSASNVCIHATGTYANLLWMVPEIHRHPRLGFLRALRMMLRLVMSLILMHALEVAVWAQFYVSQHCFPDTETAYYYSLVSYTTLGYGDVLLPRDWRIMGGWEAMIGVLMFGWSTATLVTFARNVQDIRLKMRFSAGAS